MTKGNRKIGLGVMGFADMLLRLRVPYDSDEACRVADEVMAFIHDEARGRAARNSRVSAACSPTSRAPCSTGPTGGRVRNATVTTIAPTGTISIIAGCSSGIEPLFAVSYVRATCSTTTGIVEVHPYFEQMARDRGFYSDELMKKIAEVGSARHVDGIPADVQARIRHRARHHPRVAHQAAGGVPEVARTTRCPRPSTSPTRPRSTTWRTSTAWRSDRLQGRHDLPRRQPRRAGAQRRPVQEQRDSEPGVGIAARGLRARNSSPARRSA